MEKRILSFSSQAIYQEEDSMQTELAKALERLEAITKPADSALFSALVKYDQEHASSREES